MRADPAVRDVGQRLDVRAQVVRAERAIESDRQRPRMSHRIPERLRGLPGEGAPGAVGDGAGNHDWHAAAAGVEQFVDREQCGLRVQRVEDRLDHEQVRAAIEQAARGFGVVVDQFLERHVAEARIVDVGRDRCSATGRAEHADREARSRGISCLDRGAGRARELRAFDVQFVRQVLELVVGLAEPGRVERVGLDQIRAGLQVGHVDVADDVRPGQRQQVVVALEVMPATSAVRVRMVVRAVAAIGEARAAIAGLVESMLLQHRAHRTIEHEDAPVQRIEQRLCAVGGVPGKLGHRCSILWPLPPRGELRGRFGKPK